MTIDEAIRYAEEIAEKYEQEGKTLCSNGIDNSRCFKCAAEHRQLSEWLKKLKAVKQIIAQHDSDRMPEDYWYIDKIREVMREVEE